MTALMPNSSVKDTRETSREKFIGKPLKSLYKNHAFSRKSFVLFKRVLLKSLFVTMAQFSRQVKAIALMAPTITRRMLARCL